jgi:hypothetical protein
MQGRTKWGVVIVGTVAALALGAIGVASAASSSSAKPSPKAPTGATQSTHHGDGAGRGHGGFGHGAGGGDLAEALANLSGKDVSTIMQQRAAGKSFAAIAKAYGVGEASLLAEATKIETAELDVAVKAGQITEAQRTEILSGLQAHLKEELTETHPLPSGDGRDGVGPHGFDGDGSGTQTSPSTGTSSGSSASATALTY